MIRKILVQFCIWKVNNPKLNRAISLMILPITFPLVIFSNLVVRWVVFKILDQAIKSNNENKILQISAVYLKNRASKNRWKARISKKWFLNTMLKKELAMYDYAIKDKTKVTLEHFRTLIDVYLRYNIIGGGFMSTTGDTVIKVDG